jgi:nitroreductase
MDFYEAVGKRRMVRNFTGDEVEPAALERILNAARRGPSAGFSQGQDFVVVSEPEKKLALARLCHEKGYVEAGFDPFLSRASVLIVPCTNENAYHRRYQEPDKLDDEGHEINWPVPYWFMDVGCAVMLAVARRCVRRAGGCLCRQPPVGRDQGPAQYPRGGHTSRRYRCWAPRSRQTLWLAKTGAPAGARCDPPRKLVTRTLLHCHALRKIARLVYIRAAPYGNMVAE